MAFCNKRMVGEPIFTDEKKAILKLAEQVTEISALGVTDEVDERALNFLGEKN